MGRITHIGTGLIVNRDRIHGCEPSMDEQGDQRVEDGADEHDAFAEQHED